MEAALGDSVKLRLISAAYRDLDGDRDMFPDTGETGRVVVTVQNFGRSLTGVTLYLTSDDPNVACITRPPLSIGALAAGEIKTIGSFDPAEPGLGFRASDSLQTTSKTSPADIRLYLSATAFAFGGSGPIRFWLPADLDMPPGAPQTFTFGPDGVAGTVDETVGRVARVKERLTSVAGDGGRVGGCWAGALGVRPPRLNRGVRCRSSCE